MRIRPHGNLGIQAEGSALRKASLGKILVGAVLVAVFSSLAVTAWGLEVDNEGPAVIRDSLTPQERGNTIFSQQPIAFTLDDPSGIEVSSIRAKITNSQTAVHRELAVEVQSLSPTSVRAISEPVPLEPGVSYSVLVESEDRLKNREVFAWNFRSLSFDVTPATATIEPSLGVEKSNNVWAFLPVLAVGSFSVSSGKTEHSGFGPIGQEVP